MHLIAYEEHFEGEASVKPHMIFKLSKEFAVFLSINSFL